MMPWKREGLKIWSEDGHKIAEVANTKAIGGLESAIQNAELFAMAPEIKAQLEQLLNPKFVFDGPRDEYLSKAERKTLFSIGASADALEKASEAYSKREDISLALKIASKICDATLTARLHAIKDPDKFDTIRRELDQTEISMQTKHEFSQLASASTISSDDLDILAKFALNSCIGCNIKKPKKCELFAALRHSEIPVNPDNDGTTKCPYWNSPSESGREAV